MPWPPCLLEMASWRNAPQLYWHVTYWGAVSALYTSKIVKSADAYIFADQFSMITALWGTHFCAGKEKMINLEPDRVMIGNGQSFGCVLMNDFLELLAQKVKKNSASSDNYMRPPSVPLKQKENEPIKTLTLFKHIQGMLSRDNAVLGETGDSWFNCQKLELPEHYGFEFQMQYGSIRWAVGATLGYAQAATDKHVVSCIGDGSFQISHTSSFNSWVHWYILLAPPADWSISTGAA